MTKRIPDAMDYLPKHIYVHRTEYTAKLLDLEQERDNLMHKIIEERQRVFGFEPTDSWSDVPRYHVALPQALFDQLGHYSRTDVRRVCIAWLMWNDYAGDLSESAAKEFFALMDKQARLAGADGTYKFPDDVIANEARKGAAVQAREKRERKKRATSWSVVATKLEEVAQAKE